MEPFAVAGVLGKILIAGLAARLGRQTDAFDSDDLAAIQAGIDAAGEVVGLARAPRSTGEGTMEALHFALVTRAFGAAMRDHWHDDERLAPILEKASWVGRVMRPKAQNERQEEVQQRLSFALIALRKLQSDGPADPLGRTRVVTEHPLLTPHYRALWLAFTHATLSEKEPLIELDLAGQKLDFENAFLLAFAVEMAGSASEKLRHHLRSQLDAMPRLLRRVLLDDMATWDRQHVFGDAETPGIPLLPRREIYVEPLAVDGDRRDPGPAVPVQTRTAQLLKESEVVLVRGDFGLGKSLTARLIAQHLAQLHLTDRTTPSAELAFPVFIKCSRDLRPRDLSLRKAARSALFEHARERGISLPSDHPALALPEAAERVVYLVDGLDEVQWSGRDLEDFFRSLREQTDHRHRAVVFSRKAVIPPEENRRDMAVIDLLPFSTEDAEGGKGGQVAAWLARWNRLDPAIDSGAKPPLTVEALVERNLLEVCATPIVLLMAAATWGPNQGAYTRAQIYERFMWQAARGKYEHDEKNHPVVAQAAEALRARLVDMKELDEKALAPDAMLWLMSRVAWEGQRLRVRGKPLTVRNVANILADELKIEGSSIELIKNGLLLVLQTDLAAGNDEIGFQHKSFREFLVARYWAMLLKRLSCEHSERRRAATEKRLLGARIFAYDDETFVFLVQIFGGLGWSDREREDLQAWCDERFHNETPHFEDERASWSTDQGPALREAAMAIAGALTTEAEPYGIKVRDFDALRSLVAWGWLASIATGLQASGIWAQNASLYHASLPEASLRGANLARAHFEGADLQRADISNANLVGARFNNANLGWAYLLGADLSGANLSGANLRGAILYGANLTQADLSGADLRGADLRGASLRMANLGGANLTASNLGGANLTASNLGGANLTRADLSGADLRSAHLRGANLTQANLEGANLIGTLLGQANLYHTRYDETTRWPDGFSPPGKRDEAK